MNTFFGYYLNTVKITNKINKEPKKINLKFNIIYFGNSRFGYNLLSENTENKKNYKLNTNNRKITYFGLSRYGL